MSTQKLNIENSIKKIGYCFEGKKTGKEVIGANVGYLLFNQNVAYLINISILL